MWMGLGLLGTAIGGAPETVHPGEFYGQSSGWTGTAYTTPRGEFALHPFVRSSFGLLKNVDVKAPLLGQVIMPQLGLEVAFVQNDHLALSIEGQGAAPWGLGWVDLGVIPHASVHLTRGVMVDLSVGIHGLTRDRAILATSTDPGLVLEEGGVNTVRPELSFDFRIADPTWWVVTGRSDVHSWAESGIPQGSVGTYLVHGKGAVGFSLGMNLTLLGLGGVQEQLAVAEDAIDERVSLPTVPDSLLLPLPHFQLWFRI